MKCIHCNCELPEDSLFCLNCGQAVPPVTTCESAPAAPGFAPVPPASPAPESKPQKSKKWILFAGIGVAVVAVVLIILFATGVLGGKTYPQDGIENLIENGNFTLEAKAMGSKMTMQVDIDWKKEDVTIYAETDGEFAFAIYDGYYIYEGYTYDYYSGAILYDLVAEDCSDGIEVFFDNYEPGDEIDWENLADLLMLTTRVDAEDYVDLRTMANCFDTLMDKLENKSWLQKNANYSTEKEDGVTVHVYEPDLYDLANAVLEIFVPCFEDEDTYELLADMLEEYKDDLDDINITIKLGVKKGYLVSAEVKLYGVKIKAAIEDIGSTRIDTDELEDLLDEALS